MTPNRPSRRQWWAVAALLAGLWIALAPFSRPLPGGEAFSFEATPEIDCRTPMVGILGDDRPVAEVYTVPLPADGDPVEERLVDCTGRARFRFALGSLLLATSIALVVTGRRSDSGPVADHPTR
jgi:hypothetical protein